MKRLIHRLELNVELNESGGSLIRLMKFWAGICQNYLSLVWKKLFLEELFWLCWRFTSPVVYSQHSCYPCNDFVFSFYRKRGDFLHLVENESYQWHNEEHRKLLRGMTMTVCDLAAITKPWHIEKRVSFLFVCL